MRDYQIIAEHYQKIKQKIIKRISSTSLIIALTIAQQHMMQVK